MGLLNKLSKLESEKRYLERKLKLFKGRIKTLNKQIKKLIR